MFITETDYMTLTDPRALEIYQQSDAGNRSRAEGMAIEEISGYLRDRYDTDLLFAAEGKDRNPLIVLYTMDITLYHLITWLPQKMGFEIRSIRYEAVIKCLEKVQKRTFFLDLPFLSDPDSGETDTGNPMKYGGMKRNKYDW